MTDIQDQVIFNVADLQSPGGAAPIAQIGLNAEQYIQVLHVDQAFAERLLNAAEMLNSSDTLLVQTPAPAEEKTRHQYRQVVSRNDPKARETILYILSDRYNFRVTSTRLP